MRGSIKQDGGWGFKILVRLVPAVAARIAVCLVPYYAAGRSGASVALRRRVRGSTVHSHVRSLVVNIARVLFRINGLKTKGLLSCFLWKWCFELCCMWTGLQGFIMTKAKITRSSALYHSAKVSPLLIVDIDVILIGIMFSIGSTIRNSFMKSHTFYRVKLPT